MAERFDKNGQLAVQSFKTSGFVVESRYISNVLLRKNYIFGVKMARKFKKEINDKIFTEASASVRLILATALSTSSVSKVELHSK